MNDWEKIVCLILSVNQWELNRTLKLRNNLYEQKIFDPNFIKGLDVIEIGMRLKNAGYDRGSLTFMISERILKSAEIVIEKNIDVSSNLLEVENVDNKNILNSLKGIGKKSVIDFYHVSWNRYHPE